MEIQSQVDPATLSVWDIKEVPGEHPEGLCLYLQTKNHTYEFILSLEDLQSLLRVELMAPQVRLRGIRAEG